MVGFFLFFSITTCIVPDPCWMRHKLSRGQTKCASVGEEAMVTANLGLSAACHPQPQPLYQATNFFFKPPILRTPRYRNEIQYGTVRSSGAWPPPPLARERVRRGAAPCIASAPPDAPSVRLGMARRHFHRRGLQLGSRGVAEGGARSATVTK